MSDEMTAASGTESAGSEGSAESQTPDTGAGSSDVTSAAGSASSGQQAAPAGAPSTPPPAYMTRSDLSQVVQQLFGHFNQQFQALSKMAGRPQTQAAPQQQPRRELFPEDPREMENWTVTDFHKALRQMHQEMQQVNRRHGENFNRYRQEQEVGKKADQIYKYVTEETDKAARQFPSFVDASGKFEPRAMKMLRNSIEAEIRSRGNLNGISYAAIAKDLHDYLEGRAEARYQQKIKGVSGNIGKPPAPIKGAPTKPGEKPPSTWAGAHKAFENQLKAMAREAEEA